LLRVDGWTPVTAPVLPVVDEPVLSVIVPGVQVVQPEAGAMVKVNAVVVLNPCASIASWLALAEKSITAGVHLPLEMALDQDWPVPLRKSQGWIVNEGGTVLATCVEETDMLTVCGPVVTV
jgi:hypothetical protein